MHEFCFFTNKNAVKHSSISYYSLKLFFYFSAANTGRLIYLYLKTNILCAILPKMPPQDYGYSWLLL